MKYSGFLALFIITSNITDAQFYSETIRDSNPTSVTSEDSLFLPAPPPKASTLPSLPLKEPHKQEPLVMPEEAAPLAGISLVPNDWVYQAEPYVDNLPPHLTRFLGMLIYYSNGSAYIVYTNENAIHHQKGLRTGDRILSINGKNVSFYKERFIEQLNEIRPERDMHIHAISGTPPQQRLLIIPNLYRKDEKLDQLCLRAGLGDMDMWFIANGKVPVLKPPPPAPEPKPVVAPKPVLRRDYKKSRRQIFDPILKPTSSYIASTENKQLVDMFGMLVSMQSGRLIVLKVRDRSAADNANIDAGDEIIQINDLAARSLSFNDVEKLSKLDNLILGWKSQKSGRSKIGNFHNQQHPPGR